MVVAALASVVLRRRVPVVLNLSAYDGLMFARHAQSLESGDWLGTFTHLTLTKNPGYPLLMAAAHSTGIELKVFEQLVYLLAAGAVALAVLATTQRRWPATAAFVLLALDPANFGAASALTLRDNFFGSLGLLTIALGFLTVLGVVRQARWVWVVVGAGSTGAVIALYWLTREEGLTLVPPLGFVVLGVLLVSWWAGRPTRADRRARRGVDAGSPSHVRWPRHCW